MASFPEFATGLISQYPYTEEDAFVTLEDKLECGRVYTLSPHTSPIRRFTISVQVGTREEIQTLEDFFDDCCGRLGEFDFTTDAGVTLARCRFDQDSIEVRYLGPSHYQCDLKIAQIIA